MHVDFEYTPGAKKRNCGHILCCRSDSGMAEDPEEAAGKWGSWDCDSPPIVFTTTMEFVRDEIKPDAVFWLGDSVPHDVDTLDKETTISKLKKIAKMVQDNFNNTRVYPAIGNHDSYPQDRFAMNRPRENDAVN
mmetsp:Transcript_37583/g.57576  ORF Transcript_37583/g.57576 Transcript_37583/m.57576 type:complete len:134 (-) Transcript_37583:954-1355(-)